MDKLAILDAFEAAHDKYFHLMLEHYPTFRTAEPNGGFGPPELITLAIEAHSCAIALGPKALKRLCYLGLDVLYPFDNIVDLYNWRVKVKKEKIEHTTYASIAIRIDSEIDRMRRVFSLGAYDSYEALPTEEFLVSKLRYSASPQNVSAVEAPQEMPAPTMRVDTINVQYAADSQAVSNLEKLEKETSIGSNLSTIITTLRQLLG
ncbi:hypothetical protein ACLK1G_03365 [Pseudomonas sp. NR3]|uniref:hypothetical protein n=1 Tax=Pseudomonas sp. NR3 TaxID=3155978 RepID=UPI003B67C315